MALCNQRRKKGQNPFRLFFSPFVVVVIVAGVLVSGDILSKAIQRDYLCSGAFHIFLAITFAEC